MHSWYSSTGNTVHARMTAEAGVQEDLGVAAGAARYVLANSIAGSRDVVQLFHVAAEVIHRREAPHRSIRAGGEEGFSSGARRDHTRRFIR